MTYQVTEENNISTVFLNGEIDMDVTEKAKDVILPLIEAGKEVHINLKDVEYMDSSGISVLIESHQKATELGVTKFFPIIFDRTVVRKINKERLEKIVIEASEQSNRINVPTIEESQNSVSYTHLTLPTILLV